MLKVNTYFDSNVTSVSYQSATGDSTVGVMEQGEYLFNTGAPERMTVIQGELTVQLKDSTEWNSYTNGQAFEVPGSSNFKVKSKGQTSYLCEFL